MDRRIRHHPELGDVFARRTGQTEEPGFRGDMTAVPVEGDFEAAGVDEWLGGFAERSRPKRSILLSLGCRWGCRRKEPAGAHQRRRRS